LRILFVGFSNSIHTARWINQVSDQGWDLHLFPSLDYGNSHPELKNITVHHTFFAGSRYVGESVELRGINVYSEKIAFLGNLIAEELLPNHRLMKLISLIKRLRPDIVHSMEFQSAGYLTCEAKNSYDECFPKWIATNWGSDIYLFRHRNEHRERIKSVLASCDYYWCECHRDVQLAREMGLEGQALPVLPNGGGFNLKQIQGRRQSGSTSKRRMILIKGYHGWAGRALVGLKALELCAKDLEGYKLAIYSASKVVKKAARILEKKIGIPIEIIPQTSHDDILRFFGHSRIYIGLSISDAISTSLLEAIVMGTFPIQSSTACADEWIRDGQSGFIVPPEDPEAVAIAVRKSLKDDILVDRAAEINNRVALLHLDVSILKPKVISIYNSILNGSLN
jgi:glycosyltransferase involved in cell wall biosynthesis